MLYCKRVCFGYEVELCENRSFFRDSIHFPPLPKCLFRLYLTMKDARGEMPRPKTKFPRPKTSGGLEISDVISFDELQFLAACCRIMFWEDEQHMRSGCLCLNSWSKVLVTQDWKQSPTPATLTPAQMLPHRSIAILQCSNREV